MRLGLDRRQSLSEMAGGDSSNWLGDETEAGHAVDQWLHYPPAPAAGHLEASDGSSDPRQLDWLRSVFRFTRANGSVMFGPRGRSKARLVELEGWVRRLGDPHLGRVIAWWRPSGVIGGGVESAPPPLPTELWPDRPLAILRPDWTPRGDSLAIDHRTPGLTSTIEVAGRGATWLGPTWTSPTLVGEVTRARPTYWVTGPFADAYEWSFHVGPTRVTRSAVLVRGRALAILSQTEQAVGDKLGEVRWSLPEGVEARPDPESRALILSIGPGRPMARLVPLGLPESSYPTDRGALTAEGREVVLRQTTEGPNRCLAVMVAWDKKPPKRWRTLTVAEKSSACPPGTAFAARASYRPGQGGLLVYRSLGPVGLRSVLGHQTKARFVVGSFTPSGDVRPWIKVDEPEPVGDY